MSTQVRKSRRLSMASQTSKGSKRTQSDMDSESEVETEDNEVKSDIKHITRHLARLIKTSEAYMEEVTMLGNDQVNKKITRFLQILRDEVESIKSATKIVSRKYTHREVFNRKHIECQDGYLESLKERVKQQDKEIQELTRAKEESMDTDVTDENRTWAKVISTGPPKQAQMWKEIEDRKIKSQEKRHQVLVKHSSLRPGEALKTLEKHLTLKSNEAYAQVTQRGVMVICQNQDVLENVKKTIDGKEGLLVKEPTKLKPRIKVLGVRAGLGGSTVDERNKSSSDFLDELIQSNPCLSTGDCKIARVKGRKRRNPRPDLDTGSVFDITIEVTAKIYLTVMKSQRLQYRLTRYLVVEDEDIMECFNCLEIGHTKKTCLKCTNCKQIHSGSCEREPTLICFNCGGNHKAEACVSPPRCLLCCSLQRRESTITTSHRRMSPECTAKMRAVQRKKDMIDLTL